MRERAGAAVGDVMDWKPKEDPGQRNVRTSVLILIGAWGMLFLSLLLVFAFVRLGAHQWPPEGTPGLPRVRGALGLLFSAGAALGAWLTVRAIRLGHATVAGPLAWAALASAGGFGCVQLSALLELRALGFSGEYGSLLLMTMFLHLVCAALGLAGWGVVSLGVVRARYTPARRAGPAAWTLYWQFVAATWGVFYVALYWL